MNRIKLLKITCTMAIMFELIGLGALVLQPNDCSPVVGVAFIVAGLVVSIISIIAWIFWNLIKYD